MKLKGMFLTELSCFFILVSFETKKSYEPYEYVADDYYKLDQTLSELNVDSNVAGFGVETDAAESEVEIERSQEVIIKIIMNTGFRILTSILAKQKRAAEI